ncbi:type II CAAX prenyl endopeptidase Rce1 family protein [Candidatus Izemoplasma sp. B36]|uniref:CPBP family glutamic-type intramembrane protease n=1 Tax=Candidatus Izemoplasma sp. B36 TaxID=3242468 RepID=UPI003557513A
MKTTFKFIIYTFLITWAIWLIAILNDATIINIPVNNQIFVIIGTFIPSILGCIYLMKYKKMTLKEILRSTFKFKFKNMIYILIMPLILGVSYLILTYILEYKFDLEVLQKPYLILIVIAYIFVLGGPLGEEIGWRGFLLPELQKKYHPLLGSLIIGIIWSLWHLPLFFVVDTIQSQIPFIAYIFYTIILSFLITVVYLKNDYSISSGVYMHLSSNLAIGVFTIITEPVSFYFIGGLMILALSFLLIKNRSIIFLPIK